MNKNEHNQKRSGGGGLSYGRSGKRVGFNPAKMDSKDREAMAKFRRPAYYQQAKRLVAAQGRQLEEKDALAYLSEKCDIKKGVGLK